MSDYRKGRSVICSLHVHLVFVTKHRRGVLSERAHEVLRDAFLGVCGGFKACLIEADGEDDHVHLLIEDAPTLKLSQLVNSLKGVSSRRLRAKGFPEVTARLWGGHLWSPSSFAASCGGAPVSRIRENIDSQRRASTRP
jgi:putative transposase